MVEHRDVARPFRIFAAHQLAIVAKVAHGEILAVRQQFQCMEQLVASHVASYTRSVLDAPPYDSFVEKFGAAGKAFLDRLGIVKIPANEVTLNPILLGEKFKRHADRVILRKAGVIPSKKPESLK